jgi:hypothetical protein
MMRKTKILERRKILVMKRPKDQTKMKMTMMTARMKMKTTRKMKIPSLPKHKRYFLFLRNLFYRNVQFLLIFSILNCIAV